MCTFPSHSHQPNGSVGKLPKAKVPSLYCYIYSKHTRKSAYVSVRTSLNQLEIVNYPLYHTRCTIHMKTELSSIHESYHVHCTSLEMSKASYICNVKMSRIHICTVQVPIDSLRNLLNVHIPVFYCHLWLCIFKNFRSQSWTIGAVTMENRQK